MLRKSIDYNPLLIALFPKKIMQSTQILQSAYDVMKNSNDINKTTNIIINLETVGFLTDIYLSNKSEPENSIRLINKVDYIRKLGITIQYKKYLSAGLPIPVFSVKSLQELMIWLSPKTEHVVNLCVNYQVLEIMQKKKLKFLSLQFLTLEEDYNFDCVKLINVHAPDLKIIDIKSKHYNMYYDVLIDQDRYPKLHMIKTNRENTSIDLLGKTNFNIAHIDPFIVKVNGVMRLIHKIKYHEWSNIQTLNNFPNLKHININKISLENLIAKNYVLDKITEISADFLYFDDFAIVFPNAKILYYNVKNIYVSHDNNSVEYNSPIEIVKIVPYKGIFQSVIDQGACIRHGSNLRYIDPELRSILRLKYLKEIIFGDECVYKKIYCNAAVTYAFPHKVLENIFYSGKITDFYIMKKITEKYPLVPVSLNNISKNYLNILYEIKRKNEPIKRISMVDRLIYEETKNKICSCFNRILSSSDDNIRDFEIVTEKLTIDETFSFKHLTKLSLSVNSLRITNLDNIESINLGSYHGNIIFIYCQNIDMLLSKITSKYKHVYTVNKNFSMLYVGDEKNIRSVKILGMTITDLYCTDNVEITMENCIIDETCLNNVTSFKIINSTK